MQRSRLLQASLCLLLAVCASAIKADADQALLPTLPDLPLLATANGNVFDPLETALVETETDAEALVGEFPTQEYCGLSVTDAWAKADLLKQDKVPREVLVQTAANVAKYLPCPIYEYTGPKKEQEPIFHACCSYNTFFPGHHDYFCHTIQNTTEQRDEYAVLKTQFDNWKKVSTRGRTVFSPLRFITPKCPHYTDRKHNPAFKSLWSDRVMKKVCESKNDCVGSGVNGENGVCCWSRLDTAPGICAPKCSLLEREVQGRCDDTDDCRDVGGENTLVCCHDKKFGKGGGASADRRGFCQASCSDEIAFNCGIDNKCSADQTQVRTLKNIGGDKKNTCCQSLRATMLAVPQRSCEATCSPTSADITAKDSPDLISTMPYVELKAPKKVTDHAWNMQRFAQVAARIMEKQEEIESFMQLQDKVTVAGSCADLTNAAQPLALHVANSGLAAVSPYLIMNMIKTDSFKDNLQKIHDKSVSAKDILEDSNESELAAMFGIDTQVPGARSIKPIRYFLGNFTWSPVLDPQGKKYKPDGKWFATQTENFETAMDWILGQCKKAVIDSGAAFDSEGKAIPQYGIISEWIHEKNGFKNSVERVRPQLQREEIMKRRAAFNQARVCFSLWNRIYFGTQYLAAELAKEGEKDAAIWRTVSASVSAIGSALGPLTFGATNIAGKIASHFLTQHADKTKTTAERAQKALTKLMELTMSDIPRTYKNFCYKVSQGKGVQAMHDDNGKFDSDKVCDEQRYPVGIQPIITRLCFKDEVNEIIQLRKALDAKNNVAASKTKEVLLLEEQQASLQAEIKRILRTARAADRLLQAADKAESSEESSSQSARLVKLKEAEDAAQKRLADVQQQLQAARAAQSASQTSASAESSGLADVLGSRSEADKARIMRALELVRDQDYLRSIVHDFYLPCTWSAALPAQFEAIKYVFKQIASSIACDGGMKEPEAAQFFQLNVAHLTDVEKKLLDTYNKMLPNTEFALKVVNAINKLIELGAIGKVVDFGTSQLNAAVGFNVPNWESSLMNQGRDFLKQGAKDNLGFLGGVAGTGLDKVNDMVRGKDAIPGLGF